MTYDRVLNTTDQLIVDALSISATPLTYAQIAQITGRSHIQVQRRLKYLLDMRLVSRHTKDRTVHWTANRVAELPHIQGTSVQKWLEQEMPDKVITEEYKSIIKGIVALIYAQPVIKMSTGKTTTEHIDDRRAFATKLARYFELRAAELRFIVEHLYESNDYDYETWPTLEDYDPTTALTILKDTKPRVLDPRDHARLLERWANKKVV